VIEFERHIEILLLDNDCVIVPDLGGFMAHHVDARYDDRDHVLLPPYRTLGFNPKLKINDSLLVQSYIEAYDISYPEAMHRIEDEVNELKQHLQNEGSYELNDIGTLSMNEDGKYEFEPYEAGILTPELYGLSSIDLEPITVKKPVVVETEVKEIAQPTATEVKLIPEKKETAPAFVAENEEDEQTPAKNYSLLWNGVAVAAVILAFFFFSTPLGTGTQDDMNLGKINTSMLQRVMPKDVVKGNVTKLTPAPAKQEQATTTAVEEEPQPTPYYCLVLASRVSIKNAKAFIEELGKEGFTQTSILERKNGAKVIYGHYLNEREAYNALNMLRSNKNFTEAWVYLVKK